MERAPAWFRTSKAALHVRDIRFWVVQAFVAGLAITHTVLEYAESNSDLGSLGATVQHLPIALNVIPVVLAALWYGVEGGVLTGVWATALSTPNLFIFHSAGYAWVGETLMNVIVLTVAVLVAVMAEREAELRRRSEATGRRLATVRAITEVLSDHDETHRLLFAFLDRLRRGGRFAAAGFFPADALPGDPIALGHPDAVARLHEASRAFSFDGAIPETALCARVDSGQVAYGLLVVDCSGATISGEDGSMLALVAGELGVAFDNLRMREAERSGLERYARAVTAAQEAERRRIARDLHDEAAQSIVVLARGLGRLAEPGIDPVESAEAAAELRDVAQASLRSIRSAVWALRPPLLDDLGLVPAIKALAETSARRRGNRVDLSVEGDERRLDPEVELAAFRTAQEALANADRHSAVDRAAVTVRFEEDGLTLIVEDAGKGFDPRVEASAGAGLTGMRERAGMVGGRLQVTSRPGDGTRVELHVAAPDSQHLAPSESDVAAPAANPTHPS